MSEATAAILDPEPRDFIPEDELVCSDGIPVESPWHRKQIHLFDELVHEAMSERGEDDYYVGGDMFVYYSAEQARAIAAEEKARRQLSLFEAGAEDLPEPSADKTYFRGPDVFVVKGGVERRRRKVWASWLEGGRLPDFILELQSESTAEVDVGEKKELYARVFRCREYFHYGPDRPELGRHRDVLAGHRLREKDGSYEFEPIEPDDQGRIRSEVLDLWLGRWDGLYVAVDGRWIRLYDAHGRLIPTRAEAAAVAEQRADAERRRADAERRRADAIEAENARLRKLLERDGR